MFSQIFFLPFANSMAVLQCWVWFEKKTFIEQKFEDGLILLFFRFFSSSEEGKLLGPEFKNIFLNITISSLVPINGHRNGKHEKNCNLAIWDNQDQNFPITSIIFFSNQSFMYYGSRFASQRATVTSCICRIFSMRNSLYIFYDRLEKNQWQLINLL